jgi:hypothetical protein
MGVISKSVRLPVQRVQQGLAVATDLWFWSVCSGNALYPCARALFWTEQVQEPCCAPVELGHRPAAGDSAVAQPTTTPFTGLVRAPEPIGDMPPRHIPRPTSLRALHCVPSGVVVRAWIPEPCPAATGDSGFTIESGPEFAIGIPRHDRHRGRRDMPFPRGPSTPWPDPVMLMDLASARALTSPGEQPP